MSEIAGVAWQWHAMWALVGIAFFVGMQIGEKWEAWFWRQCAKARDRQCSAGQFYYVVPESDYVRSSLNRPWEDKQ